MEITTYSINLNDTTLPSDNGDKLSSFRDGMNTIPQQYNTISTNDHESHDNTPCTIYLKVLSSLDPHNVLIQIRRNILSQMVHNNDRSALLLCEMLINLENASLCDAYLYAYILYKLGDYTMALSVMRRYGLYFDIEMVQKMYIDYYETGLKSKHDTIPAFSPYPVDSLPGSITRYIMSSQPISFLTLHDILLCVLLVLRCLYELQDFPLILKLIGPGASRTLAQRPIYSISDDIDNNFYLDEAIIPRLTYIGSSLNSNKNKKKSLSYLSGQSCDHIEGIITHYILGIRGLVNSINDYDLIHTHSFLSPLEYTNIIPNTPTILQPTSWRDTISTISYYRAKISTLRQADAYIISYYLTKALYYQPLNIEILKTILDSDILQINYIYMLFIDILRQYSILDNDYSTIPSSSSSSSTISTPMTLSQHTLSIIHPSDRQSLSWLSHIWFALLQAQSHVDNDALLQHIQDGAATTEVLAEYYKYLESLMDTNTDNDDSNDNNDDNTVHINDLLSLKQYPPITLNNKTKYNYKQYNNIIKRRYNAYNITKDDINNDISSSIINNPTCQFNINDLNPNILINHIMSRNPILHGCQYYMISLETELPGTTGLGNTPLLYTALCEHYIKQRRFKDAYELSYHILYTLDKQILLSRCHQHGGGGGDNTGHNTHTNTIHSNIIPLFYPHAAEAYALCCWELNKPTELYTLCTTLSSLLPNSSILWYCICIFYIIKGQYQSLRPLLSSSSILNFNSGSNGATFISMRHKIMRLNAIMNIKLHNIDTAFLLLRAGQAMAPGTSWPVILLLTEQIKEFFSDNIDTNILSTYLLSHQCTCLHSSQAKNNNNNNHKRTLQGTQIKDKSIDPSQSYCTCGINFLNTLDTCLQPLPIDADTVSITPNTDLSIHPYMTRYQLMAEWKFTQREIMSTTSVDPHLYVLLGTWAASRGHYNIAYGWINRARLIYQISYIQQPHPSLSSIYQQIISLHIPSLNYYNILYNNNIDNNILIQYDNNNNNDKKEKNKISLATKTIIRPYIECVVPLLINIATIHRKLRQYNQAISYYLQALTVCHDQKQLVQVHLGLGMSYHLENDLLRSKEHYHSVLQIDPSNKMAQKLLSGLAATLAMSNI